jgi:cobalt/nickel transport system permease protein
MILRGFDGEYQPGGLPKESRTFRDISYFIAWSSFFILGRILNIPALFEMLIKGGFSS